MLHVSRKSSKSKLARLNKEHCGKSVPIDAPTEPVEPGKAEECPAFETFLSQCYYGDETKRDAVLNCVESSVGTVPDSCSNKTYSDSNIQSCVCHPFNMQKSCIVAACGDFDDTCVKGRLNYSSTLCGDPIISVVDNSIPASVIALSVFAVLSLFFFAFSCYKVKTK
jgi:hypothetical protein